MEATKKGVSVMIAIALIPLVMVLGNSMLVPVLPTMESQLGISQFQSSLIITVFSFAAGVIIPLVGYLSDRYGRKMIIVPSLIVYGLGSIVSGLAAWLMENSYTMIIVGRVIQGIGAAGTAYIAMALVGDLYSGGQESKALGALESTNGLGKILSPIIGALVAIIAWYAAFFVFPVICFAVAVYVWFGVPEKKKPKGKPLGPYLQALKQVFASQGKWLIPAFFCRGHRPVYSFWGFVLLIRCIRGNPSNRWDIKRHDTGHSFVRHGHHSLHHRCANQTKQTANPKAHAHWPRVINGFHGCCRFL